MKKVFFSMAGIALIAGSALAFTAAKTTVAIPCSELDVLEPGHNCTEATIASDPDACCFTGNQYYRRPQN